MPRFYCPSPLHVGRTVSLPPEVARHALGALRLRDGDAVILFNGDGHEYHGVLQVRDGARVNLNAQLSPPRESGLELLLAQGISSGERMDITIQKAVELGVRGIQPLSMRRSVVRLAGEKLEKRRVHWQAIVAAACEQCGRNVLPMVAPISDFMLWQREQSAQPALRVMLDPTATASLAALPPPSGPVVLLAGPEGGFDPEERTRAVAAGFIGVRLGPRILRTETAALAALAAMQALWGDFQ